MIKFVILVATLGCAFAASADLDWRIVGGEKAEDGAFPYQISLRSYGSHSCGGSIINENWILTAAHCVQGASASSMSVVVGSNKLSAGGESYKVSKAIYHENKFNEKVQPINLADNSIGGGEDCVLSGWGRTSYPGSAPNDLQFIHLKTVSVDDCKDRQRPNPVYDSQVCTFTKRGEGACHGDSGGPLVSGGKQIGIVSWGRPCAVGYPDVFTRVYSFLDWINQNISN
ncbi:PREDICTED: chymotrypsin-1-like [Nicrophorus vespilloides]|uniref:Chymotrypsin-1-like n=1 Tax=Nicrophorus vespilloides TaxID=110193 RepID=A0ABM1MMM4_NICVS|nr:PREDICTED: chymotrypsin-1-like [Nicrophorus vespilloides]